MNAEALMIASGQNVKRLVAFGPRRPKIAMVAALRPPERPSSHPIGRHRETPGRGVFQHAGTFCELRTSAALRSSPPPSPDSGPRL